MLKRYDIQVIRNQKVVESNKLIEDARYRLTAQEFKVLLYLISKIKPDMVEFEDYTFDLRELCRVCGIKELSQNYDNFKKSITKLANISFWWQTDKSKTLQRWFEEVEIFERDTRVRIRINRILKPELLQQREFFTEYILENVAVMDSAYSIHLYRLFKKNAYLGEYKTSLDDLKQYLQCGSYDRYNNFKVRILDVAMEEINHFTDLEVSYQPIRTSRTITGLHFTIKPKDTIGCIKAEIERGKVFNGE